jgi:hypothetical protein
MKMKPKGIDIGASLLAASSAIHQSAPRQGKQGAVRRRGGDAIRNWRRSMIARAAPHVDDREKDDRPAQARVAT